MVAAVEGNAGAYDVKVPSSFLLLGPPSHTLNDNAGNVPSCQYTNTAGRANRKDFGCVGAWQGAWVRGCVHNNDTSQHHNAPAPQSPSVCHRSCATTGSRNRDIPEASTPALRVPKRAQIHAQIVPLGRFRST